MKPYHVKSDGRMQGRIQNLWEEMKIFMIIWFGQLISTLGSGLTSFALGVYIYQQTGSVTELSFAVLAASLPGVLLSPFAGVVADRWDRRWILIASDTGAALSTLAIWLLLGSGKLEIWHIYVANVINASLGAFQAPAYMASTTMLVPKQHFGRAAGLGQLSSAVSMVVTPILAGFLVVVIKLEGVILIDFATFLFAVITLMVVRIPMPEISE
jgi:DHA3 family macrolide efflux protein-like MFS transporter